MPNLPITWPTSVVLVTHRYHLPDGAEPIVHALQLDLAGAARTACGRWASGATRIADPDDGRLCSVCTGALRRIAAAAVPASSRVPDDWRSVLEQIRAMTAEVERMRSQVAELEAELDRREGGHDVDGWAA
ncbi:MAG TPA: hypothetical protein VNQ73_14765 [Ilumatobacter sp.]|nr:hypothetical protein [Ilumatobacter sp.]